MAIPAQRHEHSGGYTVEQFARLPGTGMLHGTDVYQYICGDDLYAVGAQHTLRVVYLDGELVTDPERAKALWQEAGWLPAPAPAPEPAGYRCWRAENYTHHVHGPDQPCPLGEL